MSAVDRYTCTGSCTSTCRLPAVPVQVGTLDILVSDFLSFLLCTVVYLVLLFVDIYRYCEVFNSVLTSYV